MGDEMDDDRDELHVKMMVELQQSTVYQKAVSVVDDETRKHIERRVASFFADFSQELLVPLERQVGSAEFKSALIDFLRKKPQSPPTGSPETDKKDA